MTHERSRLLERAIAPASEPITLADAKQYIRVDHSDEDDAITDMIVAVRMAAEEYMRRSLITQSWKLVLDDYIAERTKLPMGPVQSVTSLKIIDRDDSEQSISSNVYYLNAAKDTLIMDSVLIGFKIELIYQTGYGVASDVPKAIAHGMLTHLAALYDTRGEDGMAAMPEKSTQLYAPYREVRL